MWLISRTLFRTTNALNRRHIIVAAVIALLIVLNQTWHLAASTGAHQWLSDVVMERLKIGLSETIGLLSSCILALTFWEAFRNYRSKNKYQKRQSIIFASAFFAAAATSMVVSKLIFSPEELATHSAWILSSCALLVVFAIQYIIYLQSQQVNAVCPEESDGVLEEQNNKAMKAGDDNSVDSTIVQGIAILMQEQRLFLQSNLKISDVAQSMSVPEYKVSKAIRCHYKAPNFNHFINHLS